MGNDGGSIPYRVDLVKTASKKEARDEKAAIRDRWFFCALSKRLLEAPVVADPLGKVYNKDKLLEYLLDKEGSGMGDGDQICGYVKGVKDIMTLNPTANPSHPSNVASSSSFKTATPNLNPLSHLSSSDSSLSHHPFICPLTMREMNGASGGFVAMRGCGCVLSEVGLKGVLGVEECGETSSGSAEEVEGTTESKSASTSSSRTVPCPSCSVSFALPSFALSTLSTSSASIRSDPSVAQLRALPWLQLNPRDSLQTNLMEMLLEDRMAAKLARGENKRKRKAEAAGAELEISADAQRDEDQPPKKSKKTSPPVPPTSDRQASASSSLPTRITAELANLEAQRQARANGSSSNIKGQDGQAASEGAGMSEALKGIYGPKGGVKKKETSNSQFFRTFNRYA